MKVILQCCIFWLLTISANAQKVFKTPSGKKYHTATCSSVKNVSEEITINQAEQLGLTPCKICRPDLYSQSQPIVQKAQGQDKGVRCKGFTKKGLPCKNYTKIANGYCYHHQPQ